jgi:hypothetical protein
MKKDRFHWGVKIFTFYGLFVALIIFMVIQTMQHDVNLVSKDYYAQELVFQDQIEKINRTKLLETQPKVFITDSNLELFIAEESIGEVVFFRPSDPKLDFMAPLSDATDGKLTLPLALFVKGMYKMKLDFSIDGIHYFKEEIIVIP